MNELRRSTVYEGSGLVHFTSFESERPACPTEPTIADRIPLRAIMSRELVCATPNLEVGEVIQIMVREHYGCIPVVDDRRRPIGVLTKFDLVEQLDAALRCVADGRPLPPELFARTAEQLMMPLALTLPETASILHAARMMIAEDLHHVLVVSEAGHLVGIVSSRDIAQWLVDNDRVTLTPPRSYDCAALDYPLDEEGAP
jgi:CBS domain-containing protein